MDLLYLLPPPALLTLMFTLSLPKWRQTDTTLNNFFLPLSLYSGKNHKIANPYGTFMVAVGRCPTPNGGLL